MIGIGTIGRAAESGGGSTTYQNGKYIAISFVGYILYSSDFGKTFVNKANPPGNESALMLDLCVSNTGEVLCRTSDSRWNYNMYYLPSVNSSWTTISNPIRTQISSLSASCDFNIVVCMPYSSSNIEYYYSNNKGVSFTRRTYPAATIDAYYGVYSYFCKISADGKKALIGLTDGYFSSTIRTFLLNFSTNTTTAITNVDFWSNKFPSSLFIDFLGSSYGYKRVDSYNNQYFYIKSNSYSTATNGIYNVVSADSEDGINVYYYNKSDYNMYKTPSTILFNTGNIGYYEYIQMFTVTNGSNQVFYIVSDTGFRVYSSTGTLLYATTYSPRQVGSKAISRVIPQ